MIMPNASMSISTVTKMNANAALRPDSTALLMRRRPNAVGKDRYGVGILNRRLFACGAALGPAYRSYLAAAASAAEKLIAAIGLEPRHAHSRGHFESFQELSGSGIDTRQSPLITLPSAVPELPVDPGDTGDEAIGLDGAKNRPCFGIDLMNLPLPILPHPQRPFRPCEPRVTAAAGRRDGGEHSAALRIDFVDAILGDLIQVPAVEGRSGVRGDIDRAHGLAAGRIEGDQ